MMKVRIEKRKEKSFTFVFFVLLISVLMGLVSASILFLIKGINPMVALSKIFVGSFGSLYGWKETITKAIPLILIGSGLCVVFKAKFWNIGAEGQLLMGSIGASLVGLFLCPSLPPILLLPLMFVSGFIFGALWGLIPVLLKVKLRINETIVTLMLNYIAAEFILFLIYGPWKGETQFGFPYTDNFAKSLYLYTVPGSRIHLLTLILGIVFAFACWFLMFKTKYGYEIRITGSNPDAGRYAGIYPTRILVLSMIISGGLAGIAGVGEVLGIHHHLCEPLTISSGYGFTAIIVAWLGNLNPLLVIFTSLFFGGLLVGGDAIRTSLGMPYATIDMFNGLILFFLLIGSFFITYRIRRLSTESVKEA